MGDVLSLETRKRRFAIYELDYPGLLDLNKTGLTDMFLADLDNLPDPDELAAEIVENLEGALAGFRKIICTLNS